MGKYSTKKIHFNPKKKNPNKNHKQTYWKTENKKVDKSQFFEVKGNRTELKDYVDQEFIVKCFLTNSHKYNEGKRLINSLVLPIKIDDKNLYVNHLWVNTNNVKDINHGFKIIKVKITKYKDLYNNKKKYGVKFLEFIKDVK